MVLRHVYTHHHAVCIFDDDFKLVNKNAKGHGWVWKADIFDDPDVIGLLEASIGKANPNSPPPLVAAVAAGANDAASFRADSNEHIKKRIQLVLGNIVDMSDYGESIWPDLVISKDVTSADINNFLTPVRARPPTHDSIPLAWSTTVSSLDITPSTLTCPKVHGYVPMDPSIKKLPLRLSHCTPSTVARNSQMAQRVTSKSLKKPV